MLIPLAWKSFHPNSFELPSFFVIFTLSSEKLTPSPLFTSIFLFLGEIIEISFTSVFVL